MLSPCRFLEERIPPHRGDGGIEIKEIFLWKNVPFYRQCQQCPTVVVVDDLWGERSRWQPGPLSRQQARATVTTVVGTIATGTPASGMKMMPIIAIIMMMVVGKCAPAPDSYLAGSIA